MSMVTVLAIHRVPDGSGQFVCLGGLHTLFDLFINWPLPTSYNSRGVRAPRPSMVWTTFRRIWSCCGRCHWSVGHTSWTGGYRNGSDTDRVKHVARWHLGVIEMVKWVWDPLLGNQHDSIFFASKCLIYWSAQGTFLPRRSAQSSNSQPWLVLCAWFQQRLQWMGINAQSCLIQTKS